MHKNVLSPTYDQATDISVEELKSMKPIEDPLWDEEEQLVKSTSKFMVNEFMTMMKMILKVSYDTRV